MLSQQLRMRLLQYLHLCRQSHIASRHLNLQKLKRFSIRMQKHTHTITYIHKHAHMFGLKYDYILSILIHDGVEN